MYFSPKTSADGLVFHYDTGNTVRSYLGEPTTNLLPEGVAATHDAGSGNAVTVTDATNEKGPGWKKVTITTRGTNFRTLQWTYITMSANTTYCHSAVFDWGNMRGKNYFIYFDGNGTGARTYYRPGDYVNAGSELINSTMPDGKFAGIITHTAEHTHAFFIGNNTTSVSGLNDYFYYKEFQVEIKSHPTQYTAGTRSATQGLKDLTGNYTVDITNASFDTNAQMGFDGTNDFISAGTVNLGSTDMTVELVCMPTSNTQETYANIVDHNHSGLGWVIQQDNTSHNNYYYAYYSGNPDFEVTPNFTLTVGVWTHLVVTKSGTSIKVYKNGTVATTATATSATIVTTNTTLLFSKWVPGSRYWAGKTNVAKIYNRGLTADEVARNFNAIKSRFNIG